MKPVPRELYEVVAAQRNYWKGMADLSDAALAGFKRRIYRALTDNPEGLTLADIQDLTRDRGTKLRDGL